MQISDTKTRCLVIGGGGFIGSNLVRQLLVQGGRKITVLGRSESPHYFLDNEVEYFQWDSLDYDLVSSLVKDSDEVINLAYATVPMTSFSDPVTDVLSNLPFLVNLLKIASEANLRRLVLVSSGGTVYGNAYELPITETHLTNPISPYGISKLSSEKYGIMYHKLKNLPVVIVRPSNPYGRGQRGDLGQGFIAKTIFSILNRIPIKIFGTQGTVRDYLYIDDLITGIIAALDYGLSGEIYNIGTGIGTDNLSIINLLKSIVSNSGYDIKIEILPERSFDVAVNVLSAARLTYISKWQPQTSLQKGLLETWQWNYSATENSRI